VIIEALVSGIREFFWLTHAREMARSISTAQRDAAAELRRVGFARIRAAREFDWIDGFAPGALLYVDALRAFGGAQAIVRGVVDSGASDPSLALEPVMQALADAAEWTRVKGLLAAVDRLALDRVSSDDARSAWQALDHVASIAGASLELRSPEHLDGLRVGRLVASGIVVLFAAVHFVDWAISEPNLALNKPVTASSIFPAVPTTVGLVDGVTSGSVIGVHTQVENHAWVKIDLERSYRISSIRIYNRGDGWFDEGLPMVVQLSEDGEHFEEVARRTTHFDQSPPWVIRVNSRPARFVRVQSLGKCVVLSEVEVFGRR
jgi:hypothetical protein